MAYTYAEKDLAGITDIVRQGMLSGVLETPNVNWMGAQTFKERSIYTSGYQPHTRDVGYNTGTITDEVTPYMLEQDLDIQFYVDVADVDETNEELTAANVTAAFTRQQAIPTVDAYRFSKLAATAAANGGSVSETLTADNALDSFMGAASKIRKYGAAESVIFASSEAIDALKSSPKLGRSMTFERQANIDSRIGEIDGVRIMEAWDADRFMTAFDFSDGFAPAAGAKPLNYIAVAKSAVLAIIKYAHIKLWDPVSNILGDGWLYQNRLYHDLFVKTKQLDGVYASIKG